MSGHSTLAVWLRETRANFLVLPVVLVSIGGAAAFRTVGMDFFLFALTLAGVVLAHISVNLLNEYSDWKTGIDDRTMKTPFSGGSGMMQAGLIAPTKVHAAAWGTLLAAFAIGLFLVWKAGWPVLALMAAGGFTSLLYTEHFARWTVGEAMSGLTLGSFVVLGAYFVQTRSFEPAVVWASIPPGILTAQLLFLNEFPDAEADRHGGRRHLVIVLGSRRAAFLYAFLMLAVYGVIVFGAASGYTPRGTLLALVTIPIAAAAVRGALRHHDDPARIVPALGLNVATVLGTDALLALGFLVS